MPISRVRDSIVFANSSHDTFTVILRVVLASSAGALAFDVPNTTHDVILQCESELRRSYSTSCLQILDVCITTDFILDCTLR
jgi:hypothetical protein